MTKDEFWNEFNEFKKRVPSMKIEDVREETKKYKRMVAKYYHRDDTLKNVHNNINEQVAKILNIKKNLIVNNSEINGWKLPPEMVPYIPNGEKADYFPQRYIKVLEAAFASREFAKKCDEDMMYWEAYDKYLVETFSRSYRISYDLCKQNMNKIVETMKRRHDIDEYLTEELTNIANIDGMVCDANNEEFISELTKLKNNLMLKFGFDPDDARRRIIEVWNDLCDKQARSSEFVAEMPDLEI